MKGTLTALQNSYDRVAEDYAREFCDELARKPFDCKMLDLLAEKVHGQGVICDLGCGPGQVAGYLYRRGAKACGIDLSPEMVKQAQRLNPQIYFRQGDMLGVMDVANSHYGGVAAFYSIIHIPRPHVVDALREIRRVLCFEGRLLLTFHVGQQIIHREEWWEKKVSLDFIFFEVEEMKDYLKAAGFELEEVIEREPYPEGEYQSRRAYIFAKK
jgi:SAM-dependent methyltransferase